MAEKINKNENISIGIDLGVADIGWSVIDLAKKEVIDRGVSFFSQAEKAVDRRNFRNIRRRIKRKNHRIERLYKLFQANNIYYENTIDSKLLEKRIRAIKSGEKLEMQDIINIIIYFARHRGYIPFGDEERVNEFVTELRDKGYMPCEIQKELLNTYGQYRGAAYTITHKDYIQELKTLFGNQKRYYPQVLTDNFLNDVIQILDSKRQFWEGPGAPRLNALTKYGRYKVKEDIEKYELDNNYNKYLYENLVGNCKIYIGEKKVNSSNFYAEYFNFYNDLTNLKFSVDEMNNENLSYFEKIDNTTYKLKTFAIEELKEEILNSVKQIKPLIRKKFKVNVIIGEKTVGSESISTFKTYRSIKKVINNEQLFEELTENIDVYNTAIEIINISPDENTRFDMLETKLPHLSYELLNILKTKEIKSKIENKYQNFSEKAIKKYLSLMKQYNKNSSYIERTYPHEINADTEQYKIEHYINQNIEAGELKYISTNFIDDLVASPQTKKSLRKAITVLNKLFRKYGYPAYICIEATTNILSNDQKKEYEKATLENFRTREEARKKLVDLGYDCTDNNINKYLLLKEMDFKCAYCNAPISLNNCEIEHILPKSITGDDSFSNKTISCYDCNHNKGQRTPLAYLTSINQYEEFEKRIKANKNISNAKKGYLLFTGELIKYEKRFKNRNLNDTAYATNELANQLKLFLKAYENNNEEQLDLKIIKIPGKLTAIIRNRNGVEKDRDKGFHHAVDAGVIASIILLPIGRLMALIQNNPDKYWLSNIVSENRDQLFDMLNLPSKIRDSLKEASFENTRCSMEVKKNPQGKLYDANVQKVIKNKKDNQYYKISEIPNIYVNTSSENNSADNNEIKKTIDNIKKVFHDNTKELLCKKNDPHLYNKLHDILEKYSSGGINPFVAYCLENNVAEGEVFNYNIHGIRRDDKTSSPIVKKLRYLKKVTTPFLLEKKSINKKENTFLMYDSLQQYCSRVFKHKETGKLYIMPIYKVCVDFKTKKVLQDSKYYKTLYNEFIGVDRNELDFYMDLFNNEYIRFVNNDATVHEGFVGDFHKNNAKIIVKNCISITQKKTIEIKKINMDILGLYNLNVPK
jgi:CRISPR-associated endonuclease Csn1